MGLFSILKEDRTCALSCPALGAPPGVPGERVRGGEDKWQETFPHAGQGRQAGALTPPPSPSPPVSLCHLFLTIRPPSLTPGTRWGSPEGPALSLCWIRGAPAGAGGLRSFLPSPYGPISGSQLDSPPRPRPTSAPRGAQLGGGEGRGVPPPFAFVPGAPGPPSNPRPPRPAGKRMYGAGYAPSEGVTSRGGGATRGRSSSDLAAARPPPRRRPLKPPPLPPPLPAATRIPRRLRPGGGGGAAPRRGRGGAESGAGLVKAGAVRRRGGGSRGWKRP